MGSRWWRPSPYADPGDRRGEMSSAAAGPLEAVELSLLRWLGSIGEQENGENIRNIVSGGDCVIITL